MRHQNGKLSLLGARSDVMLGEVEERVARKGKRSNIFSEHLTGATY